jgi:DNA mismatch repair ATPase MutS
MLASLAQQKRMCFPTLNPTGITMLKDLYHPGLEPGSRVYNTVAMERNHVLLTGPNRGGKSTILKAIGSAILMSQTVGIVFARSAELPIFETICTALSPSDSLGKLSLFEAEIEFAKEINRRIATSKGPMFLMMDEIFHGTNAHDGVEASQVFLDSLYASRGQVYSVISTHYMDLPIRYGEKQTLNLCMEAEQDPEDADNLRYSYRLKAGINRFSSVREILRERGLLSANRSVPVKKVEGSV